MRFLIVESNATLANLWKRHLERKGAIVQISATQTDAICALETRTFDLLIINVLTDDRSALIVTDYAHFRQPKLRVLFITSSSFFSDGSIFNHCPNACAFLHSDTAPDDLAAVAEHYAAT